MLTSEKVNIFRSYKGYFDGYYIQNRDKSRIVADEEWALLSNLVEEILCCTDMREEVKMIRENSQLN